MFSEVLSREDWLRLWDNVLSNPPSFLLFCVVSFLTSSRHTLLHCSSGDDFEYFFHHQSCVNLSAMVKEAYHLSDTTPPKLHPDQSLEGLVPLTKGGYPVFNKYPRFIVDYQVQERERIRKEELGYLQQRQSALQLERLTEQRRQEEEAWHRQQEQLLEAESQRRRLIALEEDKLADQRSRLQAVRREVRVKEIAVMDAARKRFLKHQQAVKEAELVRMDDRAQRAVLQRGRETKAMLEEVELRTLELEGQKASLERDLARAQQEALTRLSAERAEGDHRAELKLGLLERAVQEAGQREGERLGRAQARLAGVQAQRGGAEALREEEVKRAVWQMQEDLQHGEVMDGVKEGKLRAKQCSRLARGLEEEERACIDEVEDTPPTTSRPRRHDNVPSSNFPPATTSPSPSPSSSSNDHTPIPVTMATTQPPSSTHTNTAALQFVKRSREALDQHEAQLLARVKELRQRVVGKMAATYNSSSSDHSRDTTS